MVKLGRTTSNARERDRNFIPENPAKRSCKGGARPVSPRGKKKKRAFWKKNHAEGEHRSKKRKEGSLFDWEEETGSRTMKKPLPRTERCDPADVRPKRQKEKSENRKGDRGCGGGA